MKHTSSVLTHMATKNPNTSCEKDCEEIHDYSWGQLSHVVQALASRSRLERRQVRETYKSMYGEELINRVQITSQTSDPFGKFSPKISTALSMWLVDPNERDSGVAWEALHQSEINYRALVEIFVGRKSSHVLLIKRAYQTAFRRQLDQDIISIDPPNSFQRILVALAASHNAHHADVSQHIAKCDARRLYQTGEGRTGAIDQAVVLELFTKRSIPQLNLTFATYKKIYGHHYTKSLKNQNYGEFGDALQVVVKCIYNPPKYYAEILYASIKGTRTDENSLARVLVSRAEVDMDEIQRVFKMKYGMELREAICESIPSGDYRDFLVALASKTTTAISS